MGRLIVSCQADDGDVFRDPQMMARFAEAAVAGGAVAIRANGAADIRAIRKVTDVPIIGIHKVRDVDGQISITPTFEAAHELAEAGANLIALDCTVRGQRGGALDRLRRIRDELHLPVLADIATVQEARAAAAAGASFVLPTLRGYTQDTAHLDRFEPRFIKELVRCCTVPVIAEGRIYSPSEARAAIAAGAFAVIVGTAITRPRNITRIFATAVEHEAAKQLDNQCYIGIDLGGTNTKYGIVSASGRLLFQSCLSTPGTGGRRTLLDQLTHIVHLATDQGASLGVKIAGVGIATAGWVDVNTGRIAYATDNLPGWTGAPVAEEVASCCGLPVAVENDANALAAAEKTFGGARDLEDFICITLGTGVGAGCYVGGDLIHGGHFLAGAFGHTPLIPGGLPCNCGQAGCVEVYCNAAALLRYAENSIGSAEEVIAAANGGDVVALDAIRMLAGYLARGCAILVQLLDPEAIILSGGLAINNPVLVESLRVELRRVVSVWDQRQLSVVASKLGYFGGVLGAAALARSASDTPTRVRSALDG